MFFSFFWVCVVEVRWCGRLRPRFGEHFRVVFSWFFRDFFAFFLAVRSRVSDFLVSRCFSSSSSWLLAFWPGWEG